MTKMTPDNALSRKSEAEVAQQLRKLASAEAEIRAEQAKAEAKTYEVTPEGKALTPKPIER